MTHFINNAITVFVIALCGIAAMSMFGAIVAGSLGA
jgi:hypothetical protein